MNLVKSTALAVTAVFGLAPGLVSAQTQEGLVNIAVANNTVQVPIDVAVQVCPNLDANVLATQFAGTEEVVCRIDQQTAAENDIDSSSPGAGQGGGQQRGLINVDIGDNVVQIPIGIALQVCPNLDANVLARQQDGDEAVTCELDQEAAAAHGIGQ